MQKSMRESVITMSRGQPLALPFGEFLMALFQALEEEGVRFCVLRNYEGFPGKNNGNDVDFQILSSQLPHAIHALRSIQGTRIVGYSERPSSVAITFVEGVSPAPKVSALQVDFNMNFAWKGLPYLPVDAVLEAVIPRQAGSLTFFVPSAVHEAIISLLSSLLIGGWLKEKYFPQVQRTFASDRSKVIAALSPQFGMKAATRLADSVIDGDRRKMLDCVRTLRVSLALHSLLRSPLRNALAIAGHYASESAVRFSPKTLETVCILSTEGRDNSALIESLIVMLKSTAKIVERHSLAPRMGSESREQSGWLVSVTNAVLWLAKEWLSQFAEKKNLTLRICDSSYTDLLTDPKSHGYGGPMWFARLAGKLFPSPDLWILLDPDPEGLQSRDWEAPSSEALRQLEACRAFVKTRKSYVILDASKPAARVTEEAYAAIIDTLAQRAARQLKRRF